MQTLPTLTPTHPPWIVLIPFNIRPTLNECKLDVLYPIKGQLLAQKKLEQVRANMRFMFCIPPCMTPSIIGPTIAEQEVERGGSFPMSPLHDIRHAKGKVHVMHFNRLLVLPFFTPNKPTPNAAILRAEEFGTICICIFWDIIEGMGISCKSW